MTPLKKTRRDAGSAPTAGPAHPPSAEDHRRVLRMVPVPILVVDPHTLRFLAANQAATRAFGYAEGELGALSIADLVAAEDRERFADILGSSVGLRDVLAARSAWNLARRDGTSIRVEVSPGRVDFAGRSCVVLFQAPEAGPSTGDVDRSAEDLPGVSFIALHDLKEPLHLVKGYLSLLRQAAPGSMDQESLEYLKYAYEGTERLQAIVMDLLDFLRVGARPIAREPVDLGTVLDETMRGLRLQAQEAGAVVTHDRLPTLSVDRAHITRLFQNLLSNALKFRGAGPTNIHVGAMQRDDAWEFAVKDNGIGIDPADHDRVLRPFQRVHSSDRYPGTGLGLSISNKIVTLHGGRLWIRSALGEGTEVHFTLPQTSS